MDLNTYIHLNRNNIQCPLKVICEGNRFINVPKGVKGTIIKIEIDNGVYTIHWEEPDVTEDLLISGMIGSYLIIQ